MQLQRSGRRKDARLFGRKFGTLFEGGDLPYKTLEVKAFLQATVGSHRVN